MFLSLLNIHAQAHTNNRQHLSAAGVLTESKQRCLHQQMCIRATGTPFIAIISDYHHRELQLPATDLYLCQRTKRSLSATTETAKGMNFHITIICQ